VRLFLDQGVPRRSAELLRHEGIDAVHAGEVGLSAAEDEAILAWCREHVIRVRQEGLKGPEMARLLRVILDGHAAGLTSGAMLTVRHGRVRTRALPVARRKGER